MQTGERKKLLAVGGLLVVAVAIYFWFGREPELLPATVTCVCVETGKVFEIDRDDLVGVPWKNPESGRFTLVRCEERDGALYVTRGDAALLRNQLREQNRYVDPETLQVRKEPRTNA